MKEIVKSIQKEVNEKRLYSSVKEVSNFHRIQGSTGFRDAANFVCKKINDLGIDAKILSFEADGKSWYLQQKMFMEWSCKDAWLDVEGERIADFQAEPISIIQKSYPCDFSKEPVDIVLVESNDPAYLDTLELKGKLAFIHTMPNPYMNSVIKERGALGFVTDFMREVPVVRSRNDAYDTHNYISFWWKHTDDEPKTFGFVLSPRQGDQLKALCLKMEAEYQKDHTKQRYPKAAAKIDSAIYPGKLEVVEAVLPGKSDEEIMMSAHLCHPRSSANDNSSGVAGSIEALRVLKTLTESGKIPPLEKTVRLILIPEMTGTYCYLSTLDHYDHIKGAINMDMIGGKQDGFYGPVTVSGTHHALNSPVTSIASMVMHYVKMQAPALQGDDVPMVNAIVAGYTGGSDHTIFSDTSIGIPCIMLGQWPDKYYHTSSDKLECVDPKVLAFSTSFAAGFVYALSNFDEKMHHETMLHHANLLVNDLEKISVDTQTKYQGNQAKHALDYYVSSIDNFTKYGDVDTSKDAAYIKQIGEATISYLDLPEPTIEEDDPQYNYIPKRLVVGPIRDLGDYGSISKDYAKAVEEFNSKTAYLGFKGMMLQDYVLNYADGKRTLNEIYHCIKDETGYADICYMDLYCKLLQHLQLLSI